MSAPVYTQPEQQQPRLSNRTFWIIAVALIVIVVIGFVAYVGFVAYSAVNHVKQSGPVPARYYLNIVSGDYAQAYTFLDSNATINGQAVDQQAFISLAKAADSQNGAVQGFDLHDTNDPSHITATVTRGKHKYDVHLVLKQENGTWKIISADGI